MLTRSEFLVSAGAAAVASTGGGSQAARIQGFIDAYVRKNAALRNLGVVVGAVSPQLGSPQLFFGGSPVAAREHARALRLNGDTLFLIGSITKVFTSRVYAAMQKDYGKTLGDCIAGLPPRLARVTVRDIARYGSGLPTDNSPPIWWNGTIRSATLAQLLQSLRDHPGLPACDAGSAYSYSNFSWGLMGLAAIGVRDPSQPVAQEWAAALAQLGHAIGLRETQPWNAQSANVLPAGYDRNGALYAQAENYGGPHWSVMGGGGNLMSTGNDMLRWLEYNMGRTGLDAAILAEQQRPAYAWARRIPPQRGAGGCITESTTHPVTALGWFHVNRAGRPPALTKNGGVRGFSSWMGFERWIDSGSPSRAGVFALANAPKAADVLGNRVFALLA